MMKKTYLLILALIVGSFAAMAQESMKILSYNVLVGMESDSTENKQLFAEWIQKHNPEIVAFQEMNDFTQKGLEEYARSYGHPYAVILKEEGYPVALTSKYPIVNVWKVIDNMHHGFIQARVKDVNIIVLHLSPFKYEKRNEEIDYILDIVKSYPADQKWMVMGDFNSVSPLDAKHYANGVLEKSIMPDDVNFDYVKNLVGGKKLDYNVHQKMLNNRFIDVLKEFHPEYISTCETKRYTQNDKEDKTSRIDFIYVSDNMKKDIQDAYVVKDAFTDFYSDHYPVILELKK